MAVGEFDIGIAGGMESMTRNYGSKAIPTQLWDGLRESPDKDARDCIMSMGITAENVAERYGVRREEMDELAARSQQRAAKAQESGFFDEEIVPVTTRRTADSASDATPETVTITKDDGIRGTTTAAKLSTMKPAFKPDGVCTAGNSSQISDGAAALLFIRRSTATQLGLSDSIIGKWAGTQVVGCRPDEMGIGPALAVPKLLDFVDVKKDDVNIWELNEAFASQAVHCMRTLGLDADKINPRGGAIALGHPLGATGARMATTLLAELRRTGQQVGVATLCIGEFVPCLSLAFFLADVVACQEPAWVRQSCLLRSEAVVPVHTAFSLSITD